MPDRANEIAAQLVEKWPDGDLVPHEQLASDVAAALRTYAKETRREEREACAQICDDQRYHGETTLVTIKAANHALLDAAATIRERGTE